MSDTMRGVSNVYEGLTHAIAAATEIVASPGEIRAVIDLGTNSIKLLVAEFARGSVRTIHKARVETKLERDFFGTRRLQPEWLEQVAEVTAVFASEALRLNTRAIRVIATSVARHALNQADLLAAVEEVVGLKVEVISGEQEAAWMFDGVSRDPNLFGLPLMVFDLGGGSTEFAFGQGGLISSRHSFPLGSMRLLERVALAVPPTLGDLSQCRDLIAEFLDGESGAILESGLNAFCGQRVWLVGAGGKFKVLSRLAAEFAGLRGPQVAVTQAGRSTSLSLRRLQVVIEWLWHSTRAERQLNPAIAVRRVDCILTEAVITEAIMQRFDFQELYISSWGLRHGALLAPCAAPAATSTFSRTSSEAVALPFMSQN